MTREQMEIQPCGPLLGSLRPPGSKSITNRALVCAALADGTSVLQGALDSEDTRVMIDSLQRLGLDVRTNGPRTEITVVGCGGRIPAAEADLFLANSGTSIRFLTALTTLGHGRFRLDGVERMRERPIQDLLDGLRQLGADVRSEFDNGCPPVVVLADGLPGGSAAVRGNVSSQFLSGLLMAAPYARRDVLVLVDGELVSQPYVRMTLAVMSAFGVRVDDRRLDRFVIAGNRYTGREYAIEPDASAASYFWAAAAIAGGRVTVEGLTRDALQGDVAFCECLAQMGCRVEYGDNSITVTGGWLHGITVDMNAISDTVLTLAAVALYADSPTTITGVAHIRHKESDRIGDLARELRQLGAAVEERPDGLQIVPADLHGAEIETYNDHRMAMSLALAGLRTPGVVILNPRCTDKTYPRFFDDLRSLSAR
ncbi:MAG: 3-phosphoshikimate 1-carboxyvinyltransferase [Candidatus Anammoximicrobium sp.]|mgnify:CR=1 FL=1|nr:3-phosphoshikimate 1-carboxyvinyltransferase [Candidatus Anammoximicrobium sp.]